VLAAAECFRQLLNAFNCLGKLIGPPFFFLPLENSASGLVSHIERAWMPYQVHFVRCFADEHIHLGIRVTSRAEGSDAVVKKYIILDKCDLLTVQQRLNLMLEPQFMELREIIEKEKLRVIHTHRQPIFQNLVHEVSKFAMQKMLHDL
jgi:hypothetical protein